MWLQSDLPVLDWAQLTRDVVRADGLHGGQRGLVEVGQAVAAALTEAHLGDWVQVETVAADVELTGAPVEHVVLAAGQVVLRLRADGLVHLVPVLLSVKQSLRVDVWGSENESPEWLHPGDSPGEVVLLLLLVVLVGGGEFCPLPRLSSDGVLESLTALHWPQLLQSSAHPAAPRRQTCRHSESWFDHSEQLKYWRTSQANQA